MSCLRAIRSTLCLSLFVCLATPVRAETPVPAKAPSDSEVRELARRLDAMGKQLDHLEAATHAAVSQTLMQQHWLAMQDYMGVLHSRWGVGDPWLMDPESRGGPGASACPMLGGTGAAWPLPEGVSPKPYDEQMRAHLRTLNEQMAQIAKASDPEERRRLLQEHWQTLYREMQSMRGLGWMWGAGLMGGAPPRAGEAKPLPEPDSAGAKLVSNYCVQCHAAPSPELLTGAQWGHVVRRMHVRIEGRVTPMKMPSEQELETILSYMKQHARE